MTIVELPVHFDNEILKISMDLDKICSYREALTTGLNQVRLDERTCVRLDDGSSYYLAMSYSEFDTIFKAIHLGKNWVSEYNFAGHNIISDHDMEVNYRVAELLEIEENEGLDRNTSL